MNGEISHPTGVSFSWEHTWCLKNSNCLIILNQYAARVVTRKINLDNTGVENYVRPGLIKGLGE